MTNWKSRAVKDDGWRSRAESDPDSPNRIGSTAAAIEGAADMITLGYLPELSALATKGLIKAGDIVNQTDNYGLLKSDPSYSINALTNEARQNIKRDVEEHPVMYRIGEVGGLFTGAPAMNAGFKSIGLGSNIAKGSGLAGKSIELGKKAAQSAGQAGVMGLISNPNQESTSTDFNLKGRLENASTGAKVGSALPIAGAALLGSTKLAKKAPAQILSSLLGVKPAVIKEYSKFSDRINSSKNVDALKEISDEFVGKLSADVDASKLKVSDAKQAFNDFSAELKARFQTEGFEAREAVASARQTLKEAHQSRIQQTAQDLVDTVKLLQEEVSKGSSKSFEILEKSGGSIPVRPIKAKLTSLMNELKIAGKVAVGDDASAAVSQMERIRESLNSFPKEIPLTEAKKLLQQLQQSTSYNKVPGQYSQSGDRALKQLNKSIRLGVEKRSPEYAEQMQKVSADTGLLKNVEDFGDRARSSGFLSNIENNPQVNRREALQSLGKRFNTDFVERVNPDTLPQRGLLTEAERRLENYRPDKAKEAIEGLLTGSRVSSELGAAQSSELAATSKLSPFKSLAPNSAGQTQSQQKLIQLGKGQNIELTDMFKELSNLTGTDFVQAMKDQNTLAAFQKGAMNGSRNTVLGSVLGFMFGGVMGAGSGGAIGHQVDVYGPKLTKKILDAGIKISKNPTVESIMKTDLPPQVKDLMLKGLEQSKGLIKVKAGTEFNKDKK